MKLRKTRVVKARVDREVWKKIEIVRRQEHVDRSDVIRAALDQLFKARAIA